MKNPVLSGSDLHARPPACAVAPERLDAAPIGMPRALRWSRTTVLILQTLLLLVLFIGTQMPGAWRNGLEQSLQAPFGLSKLAHVLVFASMACLARVPPLRWPLRRIALLALALAVTTEALQFLASERHPGLDDVAIDLAGAALGVWLAAGLARLR